MRCDGGYPRSAGIEPTDAEHLQSFLEDYDDAPALEVTFADEAERSRLVADMELDERTIARPTATTAFRCVLLPVSEGTEHVAFEDVDRVSTAEPPADLLETETGSPRARATALRGLATVAPERVDVTDVVDVLETPEPPTSPAPHPDALDALRLLVARRPDDCAAVLPRLVELLESADEDAVRVAALEAIATIGEERPADVAPYVEEIVPFLTAETSAAGARAAHCLSGIADHDADDAVEAASELVTHVEDRSDGLSYAVYALTSIAEEHPSEVEPAVPTLQDLLARASISDGVRLNAASALGRVASEFPDAVTDSVDTLCALLEEDDPRIRANATGVLSEIAILRADLLAEHVDSLAPMLEADDEYTLVNTTAALSRVAETEPGRVAEFAPAFCALLEHDHELVRLNACWALGHMQASDAAEVLSERRVEDESTRVRNRASWALAEIEQGRYPDDPVPNGIDDDALL